VEGVYSSLPCDVVMEEKRQKSKRLSYTVKIKHEIIQCAEEKENCKAAEIFGFD
jgi:hypothetical protein